MKFTVTLPAVDKIVTDLLAIGIAKGELFSKFSREIDRHLQSLLSRLIKKEELKGKTGETRLIDTHGEIETILLVGLGEEGEVDAEAIRKAAAAAVKTGNKIRARKISLEDFAGGKKRIRSEVCGQALAEGVLLASYRFDRYKSEDGKNSVACVEILTSEAGKVEQGVKRGTIFAESTNLARDLVNLPASEMTPRRMAEEARKIGKLPHLSVKILEKEEIRKMGMGCFLAVAKGSAEPPSLIHLRYRGPGRPKKKLALVGKGVTFDSGGLSLKTAQSMETMKDDMSGAAAMLAVMKTLSFLKPAVEVHGIAAVTENMPSGSADKPGDIVRAMNGKTVEILNTDAEGRLTLADAIPYALRQKPDLVIDMATLTGACVVALGELCSGIMGNNDDLIRRLIESGRETGEKLWRLPLIEEYKEDLKSSVADLKNVGGKYGGTINGGLFLREFVDPKVPWAHIDIAGPSWTEKELDYCPRGGTGHIVRTLLHFIVTTQGEILLSP